MTGEVRRIRESAAHPDDVPERLHKDGFTVIDEANIEFGFAPGFREHVIKNYFRADVLQPEAYDQVFPPERERAREVIHYAYRSGWWLLEPHVTTAITDRSGFGGVREYPRVDLGNDDYFEEWLEHILYLLPLQSAEGEGTMGVNFFRTRRDVVSGPHQDDENWVVTYMADKAGGGGMSELYRLDSSEPFFWHCLKPGQMMIFDDSRFKHNVTLLEGEDAFREVIVCTINKPTTYAFEPMPGLDIHAIFGAVDERLAAKNSHETPA